MITGHASHLVPRLGIADIIERCDYWRRSPASAGGAVGHKEWSYFCVLGTGIDLVIAFSLMDRLPPPGGAPRSIEEARVTLLARTADGQWTGRTEVCGSPHGDAAVVQAGKIDARFGGCALRFARHRGAYDLRVVMPELAVDVAVSLQPSARPALTRSIPLGAAAPMQWFVVPRLSASGSLRIGNRIVGLREAPAYHDHNWGAFNWGGNFAWEWAIVLSRDLDAWSAIYYRITDRGRHTVVSQGLLLWQAEHHVKTFRDAEVSVRSHGWMRTAGCLRVPPVMRLAVAGSAGDIPTRLEVSCRQGGDAIDITFALEDCAQICLPNDENDGTTTISECPAAATVTGRIDGRRFGFEGRSVIELNRGAA